MGSVGGCSLRFLPEHARMLDVGCWQTKGGVAREDRNNEQGGILGSRRGRPPVHPPAPAARASLFFFPAAAAPSGPP